MSPRRGRDRRAQVETPVILVFAVVAGVLVLLIAGWFVLRQQGANDTERALGALRDIATSLENAGSSAGTERNISFDGNIRFECDESGLALWYGDDEQYPLATTIVFAEPSLTGIATVRSYPVGSAYRVGNAVTVTAPGREGIVTVEPSTIRAGAGMVQFSDGTEAPYFTETLITGANASGNREAYLCGLDQTIRRYRFVNAVQIDRLQRLARDYIIRNSPCRYLYDETPFRTIEDALRNSDGTTRSAKDLDISEAEAIAGAEASIQELNTRLIRASCVTVS